MTPSSHKSTPVSQKGMTISHSVKDQMNMNDEMYRNNSKEELHNEIMKLNKKITRLEEGNKCLKEENKRYKSIYTQGGGGVSLKPPQSHYKVSCTKLQSREPSRKSIPKCFNQTDKFSDFGHSYSFENKGHPTVTNTPAPESEVFENGINYMTIPTFMNDKENLRINTKELQLGVLQASNFSHSRPKKESMLMQKVNRILQKRGKGSKSRPKKFGQVGKGYKSLKHTKNEIIDRINNKYGKRLF